MPKLFHDRYEAGRRLASLLSQYADRQDVLVLALPRGGAPVGSEVALALHAPLDVFLVRKLGVPGHEEFAMGAIAEGGVSLVNQETVRSLGIPDSVIEEVASRERSELSRRQWLYRKGRPPLDVSGKTVLLVDDGLATGASMQVAVRALRQQHAGAIIVTVPVAALETCRLLRGEADDVICGATPEPFHAVGLWYEDFSQTTDEEVNRLLEASRDYISAHKS